MATRVVSEPDWQRYIDDDVHDLLERTGAEIDAKAACPVRTGRLRDSTEHEVDGDTPVSACPEGHPLPTLPTRWFDGVAWRDGREACRHCYEAGAAMDRPKATIS